MDHTLLIILPLLAGWSLDLLLGDPERLPHPVIAFGHAISFCEHRLNRGSHRVARGAFTAVGLILSVFFLSWWALGLLTPLPWVRAAVEAVAIFFCLAGTTLVREVREVFVQTELSVEAGRRQVSRIVGRDTSHLTADEVRTAALETLAENLSDGVIAPLFWYAILGVPGMLAYKMVNTLDSMIGHRSDRYREFGRTAARIDDVANFIPARLTALLMVLADFRPGLMAFVRKYGPRHASPNSGYPEAALAGILDCRFGGTHDYFGRAVYKPYIGDNPRPLTTADMVRAIAVNRRAEVMMVILTLAVTLITR